MDRNQLFREVNLRIDELTRAWSYGTGAEDSIVAYICECSRAECHVSVPLTGEEFAAIAAVPAQYIVAPGHHDPSAEVVLRGSAYAVVRLESMTTAA